MTTAAVLDLIRSELLREAEQSLASADQRQARERLEGREAYSVAYAGCGGSHEVVNELGEPYRSCSLSVASWSTFASSRRTVA
jgi:hypothetical protein